MPEASVKRRVQALSGFIGCKELRRLAAASHLKYPDLIRVLDERCAALMVCEDAGTDGVAVKCVEIVRNTKGVGRHVT